VIQRILAGYPSQESSLVMVLQDIQREFNYLPEESIRLVATHLGVSLSKVFGVCTFYKAFSLEPRGNHIVRICKGTACHVRGAQLIQDEVERYLTVGVPGTTADMQFTVESVNCVGACAMAPVFMVDETYFASIRPDRVKRILKKYSVEPTDVEEAQ